MILKKKKEQCSFTNYFRFIVAAFQSMMSGGNIGKQLVLVSE